MTDITITDTKEVWVVYTNTDLTEGRGHQYPIHVCGSASTAARMATRKGVQGSDANVSKEIAVKVRGSWLAAKRLARCRPGGGSGFDPVP